MNRKQRLRLLLGRFILQKKGEEVIIISAHLKELMMETFFPEILITYLCCFRQAFFKSNFSYFQGFIGVCLLSGSRRCITRISSACFFLDKSLSSWERFLSQSHWNIHEVATSLIRLCLSELGTQLLYANRYIVAVDTTFVRKALGRMIGVQKWSQKSANEKVTVIGHQWGIASLLCFIDDKWRSFPILSRLISGQTRPSHFAVDSQGTATNVSAIAPLVSPSAPLYAIAKANDMLNGDMKISLSSLCFLSSSRSLNPNCVLASASCVVSDAFANSSRPIN